MGAVRDYTETRFISRLRKIPFGGGGRERGREGERERGGRRDKARWFFGLTTLGSRAWSLSKVMKVATTDTARWIGIRSVTQQCFIAACSLLVL